MRLSTKWTNGIKNKEDKDALKKRIEASKDVLERLEVMLEEELKERIKASEKEENFGKHAWSEYQAYNLGERAAIRAIKSLLPK